MKTYSEKKEEITDSCKMEVDEAAALKGTSSDKTMTENLMDCARIDVKGSSRGYLLWKTLKNIRKYVTKVSEPMSKGQRRSLRRQLSFQVDDLERIVLGVKPREEENSDASEVSQDEEMRGEVEAIVKGVIDEASTTGKVVNVDYFENRMRQVEKECSDLKKKMEVMSKQTREAKRKKRENTPGSFFTMQKSPYKVPQPGYGSDDHGYEGSLDCTMAQDASSKKKEASTCSVCGKPEILIGGWRCMSCRNFWNRLIKIHSKGKLLPLCDHWVPTVVCKGCRRRKYEAAMATHSPNVSLGIPPCPPPSCPVDPNLVNEEKREIKIEYW